MERNLFLSRPNLREQWEGDGHCVLSFSTRSPRGLRVNGLLKKAVASALPTRLELLRMYGV